MKRIYQQPSIIISIVCTQSLLDTSIHDDYGDDQFGKKIYDSEVENVTDKWGELW